MKKFLLFLLTAIAVSSLQAVEFNYEFDVDKNPLEVFYINEGSLRNKSCVVEPYDDVWMLKNTNVNMGMVLWKSMSSGKINLKGGLHQGGIRIFACYQVTTGKGVAAHVIAPHRNDVQLISTLTGKAEVLAKGQLKKSPSELDLTLELTADMIKVYEGDRLVCEAKRPAAAKRGNIGFMGTWGTRMKMESVSISAPDLR